MNVQILGISVDSPASNKVFAEQIGVTYPLLSDLNHQVSKDYGILNEQAGVANRTTFTVDKEGIIRHIEKNAAAIDPKGTGDACSLLEHQKQKP